MRNSGRNGAAQCKLVSCRSEVDDAPRDRGQDYQIVMNTHPTFTSRRAFLKRAGAATATAVMADWLHPAFAADIAPKLVDADLISSRKIGKARPRPDLLDVESPKGLEVIQLTAEQGVPWAHLYMEAQIFTMDSKRFVLHRSATAHGGSKSDPKHQYYLCDIENHCELSPLTQETGCVAPSVSPDGKYLYYFVDETTVGGGKFALKRVNLDGTDRRTLLVVDGPLPDTKFRPSRLYPISTISSDSKRLAISGCLGDGECDPPPYGLMVFDLEKATVKLILHGPTWCNLHSQYCRSTDPEASHDILIQENHGCVVTPKGELKKLTGGEGADIHVIRDDGTSFRNMPWGRDGNEFCQGHQCWRGRTSWGITSTSSRNPRGAFLIEGSAAPHAGHVGIKTPGGVRNDLTRDLKESRFSHFAGDIMGRRFISDAGPFDKGGRIFAAEFGEPGKDALRNWKYLMSPRSTCIKQSHIHPFLSPDGKFGFFNSDESGILHAYMVRGF